MKLTTALVAPYKGGQLEIQNQTEGYVLCGEIKDAKVEDGTLVVEFAWLGEATYPPTSWKKSEQLDYSASLEFCGVSDIGDNRIAIDSPLTGEFGVFFPPGGSPLDPARVEGLEVVS